MCFISSKLLGSFSRAYIQTLGKRSYFRMIQGSKWQHGGTKGG